LIIIGNLYLHCVSKNVPRLTWYNLDIHDPFTIIIGKMLLRKQEISRCFVFPPRLSSASALPCETQKTAHCAWNTVQLLQRSRLRLPWTVPPTAPSWTHWLQDLGSHTVAVWIWVVNQKDRRNQAAGSIQAMH